MTTKLVTKINDQIAILGDDNQYIVKIHKGKRSGNWYYPTLDMCFQEIFDHLCKIRLADGKDKKMEEVAKVIQNTRKEILGIMKPFVDIKVDIKTS